MGFLEECRRLWDFELGRWLNNTVKGAWPSSRSLEKNNAESSVDYGDPAQEVLEGTILAAGLDTILVIFRQRTWLFLSLL